MACVFIKLSSKTTLVGKPETARALVMIRVHIQWSATRNLLWKFNDIFCQRNKLIAFGDFLYFRDAIENNENIGALNSEMKGSVRPIFHNEPVCIDRLFGNRLKMHKHKHQTILISWKSKINYRFHTFHASRHVSSVWVSFD